MAVNDPKWQRQVMQAIVDNNMDDLREILWWEYEGNNCNAIRLDFTIAVTEDSRNYMSPIMAAIQYRNYEAVRLLMQVGDLTEYRRDGEIPLVNAAYHGHTDMVELLLTYGAEVHAVSARLHCRAMDAARRQGHEEIVEILRKHGASLQSPDMISADLPKRS